MATEYLPTESYSRHSFIERNRIQAALSSVVIPVQGARKSGTAHTVRFASELGRMLVGVWSARPTPTPENEMFEVLVEHTATIYDLSRREGVADMLEVLRPFARDARPRARDPFAERRRVYAPALRLLRDCLAERLPSDEEREWLLKAVERVVRQVPSGIKPDSSAGHDAPPMAADAGDEPKVNSDRSE